MRHALPEVAGHAVAAIVAEVPAYAGALTGEMGAKIALAVRAALGGFLNLASRQAGSAPLAASMEGAYALGRGEARSGRSLDALLAAYRVGARVAWRELAAVTVAAGMPAPAVARFAELTFAYIDELSAASVTGHSDELATSGRARRRALDRLAQALLTGEPAPAVAAAAEAAEWALPQTLTAVLLPDGARPADLLDLLDRRTLQTTVEHLRDTSVLLVPDAHGPARGHLLRLLAGHDAVTGPAVPWSLARHSLDRAVRVARLHPAAGSLDTEDHLVELVVSADPRALADLRALALAPLAAERASTVGKLVETLRSWLLHQGRRDEVAAELFVHPQTVRYRVARLRELYGDRLRDPNWLLLLTVALATGDDTV
ncbi:helix-turn-helix domain-containing protein [Dactylosporangium aurantiacum]|nr:helix-turn-helix domain-containing protein [Dactylosporangium aurantiacum]MDG6101496.1 helix-turn-helix domain-containing protein [Dactylosporangium aurantiacum]